MHSAIRCFETIRNNFIRPTWRATDSCTRAASTTQLSLRISKWAFQMEALTAATTPAQPRRPQPTTRKSVFSKTIIITRFKRCLSTSARRCTCGRAHVTTRSTRTRLPVTDARQRQNLQQSIIFSQTISVRDQRVWMWRCHGAFSTIASPLIRSTIRYWKKVNRRQRWNGNWVCERSRARRDRCKMNRNDQNKTQGRGAQRVKRMNHRRRVERCAKLKSWNSKTKICFRIYFHRFNEVVY